MSRPIQESSGQPGLSWSQLRAFEASARLGSFANASAALGLTASAVRYQVSLLENRIGVRLFDRNGGRLAPTAAGAAFAGRISQPMRALAAACEHAREIADEEPVILTAPPLFARHYLFDPSFLKWCEDRRIRVDVSDVKRDLFARNAIAAVRMEATPDAGLAITTILGVSLVIAAAPAIAAGARLRDPAWWKRQTIIKTGISDSAWRVAWSALSLREFSPRHTLQFSTYAVALEAASLGRGVILAPLPFAGVEFAAGRLKRMSRFEIPSKLVFSLVMKEDLARSPRGRALRRKLGALVRA